ncbi:MAG: acyltransferase [Solirubrobacterales bacterium]|nr:acyltransferase [Solirubrobacterales bacterium]
MPDREETHPHSLPPLSDPGKDDRASHGLPVVPSFDGFRAFAIMGIVLGHILGASGVLGGIGGSLDDRILTGLFPWMVGALFIVSGFVVFLPTVARDGEFGGIGGYAIRRAARLMPAYWLALLLTLATISLLLDRAIPDLGQMLWNFSGQQQWASFFDPAFQVGFGHNFVTWTLTLEIGFYLILPFIAATYFRHPIAGLAISALVSVAWRLAFLHVQGIADLLGGQISDQRGGELLASSAGQLPSWWFAFGAGMTAAWAYVELPKRYGREQVQRYAQPVLLAAIAGIVPFAWLAGNYAIGQNPLGAGLLAERDSFVFLGYVSMMALGMLALSLSPGKQLPFAHPLARRLGDISYGIFLSHAVIVIVLLVKLSLPQDGSLKAFLLMAGTAMPLTIGYGYLSARFLEQPIRRWARRFGRRAEAPGPRREQGSTIGRPAVDGDPS